MTSERFANTLPFSGVKDAHDAIVVAFHTFMIEAGYKCTGIGEEIPDSVGLGNIATDALPQGWNDSNDEYALQYKQSISFQRRFLLKALRLGTRLAVHVLDVDKESSVDLTIDTLDYVTTDNEQLLHHLYDYPRVVKQLPKLEQLFKSDIINKITAGKDESSSKTESTHSEPSRSIPRPSLYEDDPLRVPPRRHPDNLRQWNPSVHDPFGFGFGDADRLPGHPGYGGMVMDPFHQRHRRPESDFGHPGLPRGVIPPGARFDPFGPVPNPGGGRGRDPGGGRGRDPRSGRFSGPGPDHLPPPGFEDDMFM